MRFRDKVMLACMAVLVLALLAIGGRFAIETVAVKKLNMNNAFTQAIFWDVKDLQATPASKKTSVAIDWDERYPFDAADVASENNKVETIIAKVDATKKKITKWTTDYFVAYHRLVALGHDYQRAIGYTLIKLNDEEVYQLSDGYYIYTYSRIDMTERADSVKSLQDFVEANGAKFFYVNAPAKTNKYADEEARGIDCANDNSDELLEKLAERGVDTLDLREGYRDLSPSEYHAGFFRTDHHWRYSMAMVSAQMLMDRLADYGIEVDKSYLPLSNYEQRVYPGAFLGKLGEKLLLDEAESDDVVSYYPRYEGRFRLRIPEAGIDEIGDTSILLAADKIAAAEQTGRISYGDEFRGGRVFQIDNLRINSSKKVLVVRDSFTSALVPFLASGVAHLTFVDLRESHGSLHTLIREVKPDVVYVMYTPLFKGRIKWRTHFDQFDFR